MTIFRYLRIILAAFYWNLPQKHESTIQTGQSISRELNKRKEKKRLRKLKPKLPRKERRLKGHQVYRSTKSRDHRYSDQRKLRRMYRNS